MLKIALFLLIVILVVAAFLALKAVYDKHEGTGGDSKATDELDLITNSWEASERMN